jgi:hypothetical protein
MSLSPYKGITLKAGVFCGPSAVSTPRAGLERKCEFKLEEMVADVQA